MLSSPFQQIHHRLVLAGAAEDVLHRDTVHTPAHARQAACPAALPTHAAYFLKYAMRRCWRVQPGVQE